MVQHGSSFVDQVDISYAYGELRVTGYGKKSVVAERLFTAETDNLSCDGNGATLFGKSRSLNSHGNPVMGRESFSVNLQRLADGSLVVTQSNHSATLLYFVIPIVQGGSESWRFATIK